MNIAAYDQRVKQLELREKLVEIAELRKAGAQAIPAHTTYENLRARLMERASV